MAAPLAAQNSRLYMHAGLFRRIAALHAQRDRLSLTAEQRRLLERFHLDFVRAGAQLAPAAQARYAQVTERLAELTTRFSQNVLADESGYHLLLRSEEELAGLPDFVRAAAKQAEQERAALQAVRLSRGDAQGEIEPWDWRHLAEKVRQARYDLDEAELKPYFPLDRMVEAVFDCAQRLFGVRFVEQPGIKTYHPDVKAYEVRGADDALIGVFLPDNFARPSKRSGPWMSSYRVPMRN